MARGRRGWALETIDGATCYRVPLGKDRKRGTCLVLQEDWDWYRAKGYSTTVRLSGGNVMTSVGGKNFVVARILAGAQTGERVKYVNDNHKDLRRSNLQLVKGKGGEQPIVPALTIPERDKIRPEQADFYDYSYGGGAPRLAVRSTRTGRMDTFDGSSRDPTRPQLEHGKMDIEGFIADKFTDGTLPAPKYSMTRKQQRRAFPGQERIRRWGPH